MNGRRSSELYSSVKASSDISETHSNSAIESLFYAGVATPAPAPLGPSLRVFVATWNVAGKCPDNDLKLDDFLQINNQYDMYVLGFQEIVPLNAGNVLVIGDKEPAARWLDLINQSLNESATSKGSKARFSSSLLFQNASLRKISKAYRTESKRRLKMCNCNPDGERKNSKGFCFRYQQSHINEEELSSEEEEEDGPSGSFDIINTNQMKYGLVAAKQQVGIFVTVWMKRELIQHVGHLRISCVSRGIMGYLANKGCISVSMTFHQTSFCFVCSHLASGEKEGDELRRNLDVIEILKGTQFRRICRTPDSRLPEKILQHDRVIWLGDLNYRIALSYSETRKLLEQNDWNALLNNDQLKIERDSGRVFEGWKEGKIFFAPTYKYLYNSDLYFGETIKAKSKRRTPAWCDRILWFGNGISQQSYIRRELRFSDHRPVCSTFWIDFEMVESGLRKRFLLY
ncbi:hypothetical protein ACFE04_000632 [Oxalis oulophora]